ncbi:MAG: indolepyruvate ferredoxin oxidoreductase family protein [Bryobacteraceae bacterium]
MQLSDKFTVEKGSVYLTGIQALVRLPIEQMRRDRRAGLKTGSFISGYEGSPLGGYDLTLLRNKKLLDEYNIHFQQGVNEELAATSVMGTQILQSIDQLNVEGVLGIWYGKGPGVDRCGDVFRHANMVGTGKQSAALILAGDDHACKSSTLPHQSDFSLFNIGIPFFYPGNQQEILDYGAYAIALSRWSGAWTGLKLVTDICDGGGTVVCDPDAIQIAIPEGYEKTVDARIIPPISNQLEFEVNQRRLDAALRFARANRVNRWYGAEAPIAKVGIVSAGKAHYDVVQTLRDFGLSEETLGPAGIRVAKFGMLFPFDGEFAREFAEGLDVILVVEEKRSFLEFQLRDALYSMKQRPAVIGKVNEKGGPLLPAAGELNPDMLAKTIGAALVHYLSPTSWVRGSVAARLGLLDGIAAKPRELLAIRPSNFCSGCPHNRSTLLLDGQMAGGGIGCHTMAMRLTDSNRAFSFLTQMGGEGAPWIGMRPFTARKHVFQNIGDGTMFHSGQLAIDACIAAGVNITYKILYNGHVAMTGGQDAIGAIPIPQLTRKLEAEGVKRIIVLAEDLEKYEAVQLASIAEVRSRTELERTLRDLEQVPGVTAMIYDQECAAEKRRQRSRGTLAEPTQRLFINAEVCEGCGDCVKQSNCMSLTPTPTARGQKMQIHQSSCNKDYTCALGDCPSFVTVKIKEGTGLRKRTLAKLPATDVPAPAKIADPGEGYRILGPGIGGTGVVTVNALLATAAWIDGLYVATLDQTGSAQKGGAVVSHLMISRTPIAAPAKTNAGNADLILGFDLIGTASPENLKTASSERTTILVNSGLVPTIDVIRSKAPLAGPEKMLQQVAAAAKHTVFVDANRLAEGLFGSHMSVNLFMAGMAWQAGLIPMTLESIHKAIELNKVEVERNLQTFQWGRKYYHDAASVEAVLAPKDAAKPAEFDRVAELTAYQSAKWARKYSEFVSDVERRAPALKPAVERYLYKLMAYKDEYEVARLLTSPEFEERIRTQFAEVQSIGYNLHPPFLRRFGVTQKLKFGAWAKPMLKVLAAMKGLRGGMLDVFGMSAHRREERALIDWYKELVEQTMAKLTPENTALAIEIASLPEQIRGYEQIKEESIAAVKKTAGEKLREMASLPVLSR